MVTKRSISLPETLADAIDHSAAAAGLSVSAWVQQAAERQLRIERGLAGVRRYELSEGPITTAEAREATTRRSRLLTGVSLRGTRPPKR